MKSYITIFNDGRGHEITLFDSFNDLIEHLNAVNTKFSWDINLIDDGYLIVCDSRTRIQFKDGNNE